MDLSFRSRKGLEKAIVLLRFDAVLTIWDIDARAVNRDSHPLVSVGSELCLVVYTVELCIFFSVKGICVMREMWRDTLFMRPRFYMS